GKYPALQIKEGDNQPPFKTTVNTIHSGFLDGPKSAFMAATAHFIHDDYKMVDLTIAIPHLQVMLKPLRKNFFPNLLWSKNASTNAKMAHELQSKLCFQPKKKLLGCIAHVINLGAKAGLAVNLMGAALTSKHVVNCMQPELRESGAQFICLYIDQFNFGNLVITFATITLAEKYQISSAEWDQAPKIIQLIFPASLAPQKSYRYRVPLNIPV
ncbi:uncharacterized protein VP01_4577g1, partial [Puccinia sorghi]